MLRGHWAERDKSKRKSSLQGENESLGTWQASGFMLHVIGEMLNCGDRELMNPESNLTSHRVWLCSLIIKYQRLVFCMAFYIFPSFFIIRVLLYSTKALAHDYWEIQSWVVFAGFHHCDKILWILRKENAYFGSRFQGFQPMSFGLCWSSQHKSKAGLLMASRKQRGLRQDTAPRTQPLWHSSSS